MGFIRISLCCVLIAVQLSCSTLIDSDPVSQDPAELTAAGADQIQLCVLGREVVRLAVSECIKAQNAERASESRANRLLNAATLNYETSALSVDLLEGISLGAHYKYRVEPSYRENYFTRVDAYTLKNGANPGDLLGALPISVGLSRNSEILFAQQFTSGTLARSPASTYLPTRLPLTAERALALKPGDYVRFRTQMGLLANAGQVWPLAGYLLKAGGGIAILLEGEYQVHVFRLDEGRVRIRLVAERARDLSARSGVSVTPVVKAAILNRIGQRLEPLANLATLDVEASLAASRERSELFLVDYTLNLRDAAVADAYSALFKPRVSLSDVVVANPLRGNFQLRDKLLSSIEELDQLARAALGEPAPRVDRHFQGSNYAATSSVNFNVKLSTFDVTRTRLYRNNFLTRSDLTPQGDVRTHYLLPTWSHFRDRNMMFGMLDENQRRSADALFVADAQGNPVQFLNIGFGLEYKDARLRPSEYRRMRRKIELLLNDEAEAELAELMAATGWLEDKYRRNISVSLNYFFRKAALDGLVAAGFGEQQKLRAALVEFIAQGIDSGEFPYYQGTLDELIGAELAGRAREQAITAEIQRRWSREIARVSDALSLAFTAGEDNVQRMNAVLRLRRNSFYQRVGTAFWAELVQQAELDLKQVMFLRLQLTAEGYQGIEYTYGEPGERALYESVQLIQTLLNDRSLDMRRPGDLDSVISRMIVVGNPVSN